MFGGVGFIKKLVQNKRITIFERITSAYILLMVMVFLFYCGNKGYSGIQDAKFLVFHMLTIGYIMLMLICFIEGALVGYIHIRNSMSAICRFGWTRWSVIVYCFVTWISAICSPYFPQTIWGASRYEGAATITLYCVTFLLVSVYGHASKYLLWIFAAAVTVFDVICILQLAGLNPFGLYPDGYNYFDAYVKYSGAYLGTTGNVDITAAFLCLAIPVLAVAMIRSSGKLRFCLLLPVLGSLYVMFKMDVLAGIVGLGCTAILAVPVVFPASEKVRRYIWISILVLCTGSVALLYYVDFGSGLFHEIHLMLHGIVEDTFGSGRIYIWRNVLEQTIQHPILGMGPDTMIYADIKAFSRYDASLGGTIVSYIDVAHSEYLNIFYHQGVIALAAYLSFLAAILVVWGKNSRMDTTVAALGTGALCYMIQAMFSFSMCITAPFFWIVAGLLIQKIYSRGAVK